MTFLSCVRAAFVIAAFLDSIVSVEGSGWGYEDFCVS